MMNISGGYVPLNLAQIYCEDVTSLNTLWYEDILSGGSMLDGLQYLQAMVITWFPSLLFFWEVGSWYFNMKQFIQIVSGFKLFSRVQPCLGWVEATHFFSGLKTTSQTCSVRRLLTSFWVMFRTWNDSKWTSFPQLIQEKMLRHDVFRPCKTDLDGRDGCFAARFPPGLNLRTYCNKHPTECEVRLVIKSIDQKLLGFWHLI